MVSVTGSVPFDGLSRSGRARWPTCLKFAQELLLVGPNNIDLKLRYLDVLLGAGLPAADRPKRRAEQTVGGEVGRSWGCRRAGKLGL
jgi:hypothetical protein